MLGFDLGDDDELEVVVSPPPYDQGIPPTVVDHKPPPLPGAPRGHGGPPRRYTVAAERPSTPISASAGAARTRPRFALKKGFVWGRPIGPPCDAYNPRLRYRPAPPGQCIVPMELD